MQDINKLYQLPSRNGSYGISWLPITAGLLLIVFSSCLSTQFLALKFSQSPMLGEPVLSVFGYSIYQPFAWIVWNWRFREWGQQGQYFTASHIIVGIGSLVSLLASLVLFYQQSKKDDINYDVHGSARWANKQEIIATGLLTLDDHR